ncbi:MAG: nitronate monooxygenase [Promethearchaeota archaeon]|nr:MAG: nitronate monooxygenase [Candidatus Lokiarchaeota archaeon]
MIWKTRLTEMMGSKYPIIMGAFAVIGKAEFAAAFSNAGGFGIITALNYPTPQEFECELDKMKDLTDKPWGVNFTVRPPKSMVKRAVGHTEEFYEEYIEITKDHGVKFCTTSAYQSPNVGKELQDAGIYWVHKCATIPHAVSAESMGADAVTIVGVEGTGFKNPQQNTTLINMTVAKKLLSIPIIAAGGIGDARGFLSAIAMGADAVCFGTAIIPTTESLASNLWKKKVINQDIFDEKFYKKIFHHELKDSPIASMAAGHCDKVISIEEFIQEKIIGKAEKILSSWGYQGNKIDTTFS